MVHTAEPTPGWAPAVTLDLFHCSAVAFQEAVDGFHKWADDNPSTRTWESGWWDLIPELSEDLLKRNKRNRKASLGTVQRYARDMLADQWRATGQPGLIDTNGEVFDIQHRAYAGYFSGATFRCYIVADVPVQDDLFAYLDGGKPRSAADALFTAGADGLSGAIAAAIKVAFRYDNNGLGVFKQPVMRALTNPEVLAYSRKHPGLGEAAHHLVSNYPKAVQVIKAKGVAVFAAWKIIESYGTDVLDTFLLGLGSGANLEETSPILALRNRLVNLDDDDLNNSRRLALIIKGFAMHLHGQPMRRKSLALSDDEKFPRFETIKPLLEAEAAE